MSKFKVGDFVAFQGLIYKILDIGPEFIQNEALTGPYAGMVYNNTRIYLESTHTLATDYIKNLEFREDFSKLLEDEN